MTRTSRALALAAAASLALAACTDTGPADPDTDEETADPGPEQGAVQEPEGTVFLPGTDGELALAASQAFFTSSPVLVVADDADDGARLRASSAAVALGSPVLLDDGADLAEEVDRLGVGWVLTVGDVTLPGEVEGGDAGEIVVVPAPADDAALTELLDRPAGEAAQVAAGEEVSAVVGLERGRFVPLQVPVSADEPGAGEDATGAADGEDATAAAEDATEAAGGEETTAAEDPADEDAGEGTPQGGAELPATELPEPVADTLVLAGGGPGELLGAATASAAGAEVLLVPGGDPRASAETVAALASRGGAAVVGLGDELGDEETFTWRAETAATGVELPGGGQLVFPGKRYVALYGTPGTAALGVLGEQGVEETLERAAEHARPYEELTDDAVIPSLEIIATVASADATDDGNYSNELPIEQLRPLVEAAGEAGQYVVLDLQPGRSTFLEQAQRYAELLELPHVGLALDPEWNLEQDQVHLRQIGTTTAGEINEVVHWLADFTRERRLPQKMLILHQFQVRMIQTVPEVDLSRTELEVLVHVDGQGSQPAKQETWRTLLNHGPDIRWWGWKNFYDEDTPMLTPEQTAQVEPFPHFISYQ